VTVSHQHHDHNNTGALRGTPFIIDCAGEYDFKGVLIEGIDSYHDDKEGAERGGNIIYRIEIDDISVTHLGDLGQTLDNAQLEKVVGTDILLIPVGGKYTIDAKKAVEVISQMNAESSYRCIIKTKDSRGGQADLDGVEKFIKEIGLTPTYEEN